jgi:hypothetical protein
MADANVRVRIALDIDGDDGIWETRVPTRFSGVQGVKLAAAEALAFFIDTLTREAEQVGVCLYAAESKNA